MSGALKPAKVPCVLIGGFALNHYQVARQTQDVDFLITTEGYAKLKPALRKAGYREEFNRKLFARLVHNQGDKLDIDFLFVDPNTLMQVIRAGKKVKVSSKPFIIPSLEHLLALKLHALHSDSKRRLYKDMPDILDLIRLNGIKYRSSHFKRLCLKYADGDIYHVILEGLKHYE